jgi:hypothetical protein
VVQAMLTRFSKSNEGENPSSESSDGGEKSVSKGCERILAGQSARVEGAPRLSAVLAETRELLRPSTKESSPSQCRSARGKTENPLKNSVRRSETRTHRQGPAGRAASAAGHRPSDKRVVLGSGAKPRPPCSPEAEKDPHFQPLPEGERGSRKGGFAPLPGRGSFTTSHFVVTVFFFASMTMAMSEEPTSILPEMPFRAAFNSAWALESGPPTV